MVQSLPQPITLEEFLDLPETKPASEYIGGHILQKPMPQGKHSTIQTEFSATVNVFPIAPDWTIEILSPDQSQTKVTKNILHCLNHGTHMGWLIDPDEQTIFVYLPKQQPEVFDEPDQPLPVPAFANALSLTVGSIFAWLLE
ncbi:Uma2 family endonuclease [Nodosilinea sp. PGN35]|uniref:Uma2 family endonuclease n=1 Tax=Nodosilinea sp. PGN35 TaxID=3020489 RepID=UPI0023B297BA|nr:Uma2 family endonuclease [Nodosilinea sp. TSF1-S3]MDF0367832.1 Uma2 family endonuclease [Nodosilinea sp. TSF1-S3]